MGMRVKVTDKDVLVCKGKNYRYVVDQKGNHILIRRGFNPRLGDMFEIENITRETHCTTKFIKGTIVPLNSGSSGFFDF